jgi:hypothetical protein
VIIDSVGKSLGPTGQTRSSAHYAGEAESLEGHGGQSRKGLHGVTPAQPFVFLQSRFQAVFVGPESPLFAHFPASVFMGSTFSHFTHRSWVLPVRSVIAIISFCTSGSGDRSWRPSRFWGQAKSRKPKGTFTKKHWYYGVCPMRDIGTCGQKKPGLRSTP